MTSTSVAGRSEQYLEIKDYELQQGRNITYSDILSRQKVCVIGAYVAQELFGSAEKALGDTLKVGGYAYKVVGVAEIQDEDDMSDGGTDDLYGFHIRLPLVWREALILTATPLQWQIRMMRMRQRRSLRISFLRFLRMTITIGYLP